LAPRAFAQLEAIRVFLDERSPIAATREWSGVRYPYVIV
jgi:hypothetical protein